MLFVKILFVLASYLVGSLNSAIIVGRLMGLGDIRKKGSHNAGTTNMLRVGGKKAAVFTFSGDILKGVLVVLAAKLCREQIGDIAFYLSCFAVILGHNFPIYFGFKGGKGIATSAAVMLVLDFPLGIIVVAVAVAVMAISKYVSLGSVTGAVIYPAAVIISGGTAEYIAFAVLTGLLAVIRHRTNIVRLINGTENKLSKNKKG